MMRGGGEYVVELHGVEINIAMLRIRDKIQCFHVPAAAFLLPAAILR